MFLSYDCFIKDAFGLFGDSLYIFKVFISSFIPLLLLIALSLIGLLAKLVFWKKLNYWWLFIITLITLFFNLYSGTSSNIINLFNCKTIENEKLLAWDLTVECWKGRHLIWALSFGTPFMVFWTFGLPLFGIMFLFINWKKVGMEQFNTYYILLY